MNERKMRTMDDMCEWLANIVGPNLENSKPDDDREIRNLRNLLRLRKLEINYLERMGKLDERETHDFVMGLDMGILGIVERFKDEPGFFDVTGIVPAFVVD